MLKQGKQSKKILITAVALLLSTLLSASFILYMPKTVKADDTVTITLDANGGYFSSTPYGSTGNSEMIYKDIPVGTSLSLGSYAEVLKHSDAKMKLIGWSENKDYKFKYDSYADYDDRAWISRYERIESVEDKTLYAIWAPIVDITFDANGGVFGDGTTVKQLSRVAGDEFYDLLSASTWTYMFNFGSHLEDGELVEDPLATNGDLIFGGWTTQKNDAIGDNVISHIPETNITLYATWGKRVTITADGNGYELFGKTTDGMHRLTLPAGIKIGEIYMFRAYKKGGVYPDDAVEVKWALDREGKNIIPDIKEFIPQEDITWYAVAADAVMALAGDVNGDQKVDSKDLTTLAKHVAKIALITDPALLQAADVNGDDKIDSKDLTHLAKYVAKIIPAL